MKFGTDTDNMKHCFKQVTSIVTMRNVDMPDKFPFTVSISERDRMVAEISYVYLVNASVFRLLHIVKI
jgi:hypothetical protein